MAAKAKDPDEQARRCTLGIMLKYLTMRGLEPMQFFRMSQPTWCSRKKLESDFSLPEMRLAARTLDIPDNELAQMLRGDA